MGLMVTQRARPSQPSASQLAFAMRAAPQKRFACERVRRGSAGSNSARDSFGFVQAIVDELEQEGA
jgi:hypothetical protein